jgi:hypothetical protein
MTASPGEAPIMITDKANRMHTAINPFLFFLIIASRFIEFPVKYIMKNAQGKTTKPLRELRKT